MKTIGLRAIVVTLMLGVALQPGGAQVKGGNRGGGGVTLPIDLASQVTGVLPSINGGAGTSNGVLQANGSGAVSAVTIGSGLSFSGGTLSATGSGGNANFGTATGNTSGNAICMANTTVGIQDCGYSASAIPTNKLTNALNAQTGTTYTVLSTDGGKIVSANNASAIAFTLFSGATAGSGWAADFFNKGAGLLTTTLASGNFDNGATSIVTAVGQDLFAWSDGTNMHSVLSLPVMAADTVLGNFSAASNYPTASTLTDCHAATSAVTYNTTSHAWGCNTISGSGTVNSGTAGNGAYYASSTTAVSDAGSAQVNFGGVSVASGTAVTNGIALKAANDPCLYSNSVCRLEINTTFVQFDVAGLGTNAASFQLASGASSSTVPTLMPNRASTSTGIGAQASGNMSLIAGGTEIERITSTGPLLVTVPTDATHTDATLCRDTTSGAVLTGTGTAGICLGTSSLRFKHGIIDLAPGLAQIMALKPKSFYLNKDHGDPNKQLYGFIAEDMVKVLPKLVVRDKQGRPNTADYLGVVPVLVKAIQQQQGEIDSLKRQLALRH